MVTIPMATMVGARHLHAAAAALPAAAGGLFCHRHASCTPCSLARIIEALDIFGGTDGIMGIDSFSNRWVEQYSVIGVVLLFLFGLRRLVNMDLGLVFRAVKDNDQAVRASGMNITCYKAVAVFIASAMGCLGGACLVHIYMWSGISQFALDFSILPIAATVIGGGGTLVGPVLGCLILVPISELLRDFGTLRIVFYSLILVGFIVFRSEGIMVYGQRKYHQFERWVEGMTEQPILKVKDLTKAFGGVQALNRVSFDVNRGESWASSVPTAPARPPWSTASPVSSSRPPARSFQGQGHHRQAPHKIADMGVTRTFQIMRPYYSLPAYKNLVIPLFSPRAKRTGGWRGGGKLGDRNTVGIDILEEIGFERDSYVPYKMASTLPTGYLKRLELARCLALKPEMIICDEVFSGLSMSEIASMVPLIERLQMDGITLIMIEHRLRELFRVANRVMVLNFGEKLMEGTPRGHGRRAGEGGLFRLPEGRGGHDPCLKPTA